MIKKEYILILLVCCAMMFFSSCVINPQDETQKEMTYLHVANGIKSMTRSFPGDDDMDNKIATLRILGFDASGYCISNKIYEAERYDIIKHEIPAGRYDFVFIANEPISLERINHYNELQNITFNAEYIDSDTYIPMVQEIKDVEVLASSKGAKVTGGSPYVDDQVYQPLQLYMSRLAVRVDVVLLSNGTQKFNYIEFSNIPEAVPLLSEINYCNRSLIRHHADYVDIIGSYELHTMFNDGTIDLAKFNKIPSDVSWAVKIPRIILPFSNFTSIADENMAIKFSVRTNKNTSPLPLQSDGNNNYTLPRDKAILLVCWVPFVVVVNT